MRATSALLERESEVQRLSELVDAAREGHGATVAIEGPAGIGKSRLLARAGELARDAGLRVLAARGGELEQDFAYGVVRQVFEPGLAGVTAEERGRALDGAARLAAPAISFGDPDGVLGEVPAAAHGLYWLAANLASEQAFLLSLDDAHWADAPSLRFLTYLARRVEELPILIAYAARPAENAVVVLPVDVEPGVVSSVLRPAPLSQAAATELTREALGPASSDDFARACHTATGGNPFLLRELLAALEADGTEPVYQNAPRVAQLAPAAISRSILARLRRLGRPAHGVAAAVAVLGARAEPRFVAALAQLEPDAVADAADGLIATGILREGTPLEFVHPVIRAAVYAEIPPLRRAARHKDAAAILELDGTEPGAIAAHLLKTEPAGDSWAVQRLRQAAAAAFDRGAPETACTYLERAWAEPPDAPARARVLQELGSAELRAARPGAHEHLRAALEAAGDSATRAQAAVELAIALTAGDRVQEAVELLSPVIDEIARADPETAMRLEADLFGATQIELATTRVAWDRVARHRNRLSGTSPGERMLMACLAFQAGLRGDSAERAAELAECALADGALLHDQRPEAHPFYHALMPLAFADRLDETQRYLELAVSDARARGSALGYVIAGAILSHVLARQGRLAEAEAEARAAFDAARVNDWPALLPMVIAYLLDAMLERADPAVCQALLEETGTAGALPPATMANPLLHARGHLYLAAGRARRALDDFDELRRRDELWGVANPAAWPTLASASLAHAQLGRLSEARTLAHEGLERARRWGAPSTIAVALRTVGMVEGGQRGIALLAEAAEVAERSPARYEQARSLAELGAALRRAGRRSNSRQPLREALDLAHRCGARRLAARAREELVAAGARPRRMVLTGLDSLTASERRVAQLAADGLANREIAQALFVTKRTVEMHLTHAYQKLGIGSREELPAALGTTAT